MQFAIAQEKFVGAVVVSTTAVELEVPPGVHEVGIEAMVPFLLVRDNVP
jgi:hypothetical protein